MQDHKKLAKLFSPNSKRIALLKSTIKKCRSQFKLLDGNHVEPKNDEVMELKEREENDISSTLSTQDLSSYYSKSSFKNMKGMNYAGSKLIIDLKKQDEDILYDCSEEFRKSNVDSEIEAQDIKSLQDELRKLGFRHDEAVKNENEDIIYEFKRTTNLDDLYQVKKQVTHIESKANKDQNDSLKNRTLNKVIKINKEEDFSNESVTYSNDEVAEVTSKTKSGSVSIKCLIFWLMIIMIGYLFLSADAENDLRNK